VVDVSASIMINRPVEDVFAYVTDVTNDPTWHTDALEAQKMTEGPIGLGTRWRVRFKPSMGVCPKATWTSWALRPTGPRSCTGNWGPWSPR